MRNICCWVSWFSSGPFPSVWTTPAWIISPLATTLYFSWIKLSEQHLGETDGLSRETDVFRRIGLSWRHLTTLSGAGWPLGADSRGSARRDTWTEKETPLWRPSAPSHRSLLPVLAPDASIYFYFRWTLSSRKVDWTWRRRRHCRFDRFLLVATLWQTINTNDAEP